MSRYQINRNKLLATTAVILFSITGAFVTTSTSRAQSIVLDGSVMPSSGAYPSPWDETMFGLFIGMDGPGSMKILEGGIVTTIGADLAFTSGSTGLLVVDGLGSQLIVHNNPLTVGYQGQGTVEITNGGSVATQYGVVGVLGSVMNRVTINGQGSQWKMIDGGLQLGDSGHGQVEILDGGYMLTTDDTSSFGKVTIIGKQHGSNGVVTVKNAGSFWESESFIGLGGGRRWNA